MSTQTATQLPIDSETEIIHTSIEEAEDDVELCACGKNINDEQTVTLYTNISINTELFADQIVENTLDMKQKDVMPTPRRDHITSKRAYHIDDVIQSLSRSVSNFSPDTYENFFTYDEQYTVCLSCAIDAGVDITHNNIDGIDMDSVNSRETISSSRPKTSDSKPTRVELGVVGAIVLMTIITVVSALSAGFITTLMAIFYNVLFTVSLVHLWNNEWGDNQ